MYSLFVLSLFNFSWGWISFSAVRSSDRQWDGRLTAWKCCPSTLKVIYLIVLWGQLTLGKIALLLKKLWLVQKPECGLKAFKLGKHDVHRASYVKLKFITDTWRSSLKYLLIFCSLHLRWFLPLKSESLQFEGGGGESRLIYFFIRDHFWNKSLNNYFLRLMLKELVSGTELWAEGSKTPM